VEKCGRTGRYAVQRVFEKRGRDGKVIDWKGDITADSDIRCNYSGMKRDQYAASVGM
jgi:hypothetical protein